MLKILFKAPRLVFINTFRVIWEVVSFTFRKQKVILLILIYSVYLFLLIFTKIPLLGLVFRFILKKPMKLILAILNRIKTDNSGINSANLIELGVRNIQYKKARSFVTIGGMAIGIGAIVFLMSLGYGVQKMVVNKVARLEELRQATVTAQPGSKARINDEQLSKISKFQGVDAILPLISVVGRVNYNNSIVDLAVYGVTSRYLAESAEKPIRGALFKNDKLSILLPQDSYLGEVAGATTKRVRAKMFDEIGSVNYTVEPGEWVTVREKPTGDSPIIGFAKRTEGQVVGALVIGSSYNDSEEGDVDIYGSDAEQTTKAGKWLRDTFQIWDETSCDPANVSCDASGTYEEKKDTDGGKMYREGFIALSKARILQSPVADSGEVLGLQTLAASSGIDTIDITEITASGSALASLTEIASESARLISAVKNVDISGKVTKQAVVNRAMLTVLGMKESDAVGKQFETSFVVTGDLLENTDQKIESIPVSYTIVGVVSQNNTPFFYVPFIDLRTLGVQNFSQAKIISSSQNGLGIIRQKVEGMGFNTTSVSDTVAQIDSLFATVRMVLLALGVIALSVAAMGMFNTLTVSLLERTHEVGLMKTMGMKSNEIENLFLVESVVMGILGGWAGLTIGFVAGKTAGLILTLLALNSGVGLIDVSYIPPSLVGYILLLSFVVGFVTGIYPAQRARKISALNALHYE